MRRDRGTGRGELDVRQATALGGPFLNAVARRDFDAAAGVLAPLRTAHAGTPPAAVKGRAARLLARQHRSDREALLAAATALAETTDDGAKEIGLLLIGPFFAAHPSRVGPVIARLADDPNWEVREIAAAAVSDAVAGAGPAALPWLHALAADASPNGRRAAAVGSGWAARRVDADLGRQLLALLDPLMNDDDRYVGRNLGAFAVGDGFLRAHPEITRSWLAGLATSEHPRVRWNVAMALTAAEAAKHLPSLYDVLTVLAADRDPAVQRAVTTASRKLLRRRPEEFQPLLQAWLADPTSAPLASRVLSR